LAFGNTRSAGPWRHPEIDNSTAGIRRRLVENLRIAEAGTFDGVFFADGLNYGPQATWAYKTTEDFEPLTTASALSLVTERIGLVVTGSATLQHPYHLARQLLSLDHLSGGRAGWNLVTSFARAAADNFSARGVVDHDERYRVAEEAIEVVEKLWDSWGDDTIVEDQSHFYQIAMLAVLTGITGAALRDGSTALTERKRNYPQGLAEVPTDDAQLLQVIGSVSADVFGAEAALARSARSLDRVAEGRLTEDDGKARRRLIDAEVAVAQAQLVIIAGALRATTTIFDALGASAVSEDLGLDRHWRNARTLASHNPRVYKARILGDWLINGKDPVPDLAAKGRGGQGN
jgi:hypothetical protein